MNNIRYIFRPYAQHWVVVKMDGLHEIGIVAHCDTLAECKREVAEITRDE